MGMPNYRGGSPPSQCQNRIMKILTEKGPQYMSDIRTVLAGQYRERTIRYHVRALREAGRVECVVTNGGIHRLLYRVKKR